MEVLQKVEKTFLETKEKIEQNMKEVCEREHITVEGVIFFVLAGSTPPYGGLSFPPPFFFSQNQSQIIKDDIKKIPTLIVCWTVFILF